MLSHLLFKDKLTSLFCLLDDFLALLPKPNGALDSGRNPVGSDRKVASAGSPGKVSNGSGIGWQIFLFYQ
jgi:hypothetical protein